MKHPGEFSQPSMEYSSMDVAEFTPAPDEFHQKVFIAEKPKKKRHITQFVAGVIAAAVVVNTFVHPPEVPIGPPEAEPELPPIVETTLPAPTEVYTEPTEPPFEMETLDTYPNPSDTCSITVYGDYFDFGIMGNPILMEVTVQESSFTELTLPDSLVYDGCSMLGYVIAYNSLSDDFRSTGYNPGSKAFAANVGFSLTLDELQLVPVWEEDQVRHVYVHPIWVRNEGSVEWENAPVVTLVTDEKVLELPIDFPLASGGVLYVCSFTPQKDGFTFAGWYNESDERIDYVFAEDLFQTFQEGTNEIDWKKPTNITLTAKWVKNP